MKSTRRVMLQVAGNVVECARKEDASERGTCELHKRQHLRYSVHMLVHSSTWNLTSQSKHHSSTSGHN